MILNEAQIEEIVKRHVESDKIRRGDFNDLISTIRAMRPVVEAADRFMNITKLYEESSRNITMSTSQMRGILNEKEWLIKALITYKAAQ